ncbi:hypothetical protein SARC_04580 [Sphaeroforma arctica JP610]|uniref:Uncharacterized protein n=1 Tax=Sphaeroforma arctica JP610 TaxID=667725 RepID=A0A0L0G2W1_9EUKA|nr:hypothetical protein SARC_04580 [Sphaeroforma arctica JP610]KNC83151.1 hypothetical protein SARC_04580 [Sphaeroforma arctica JP610]|eukprot:XP_014157053.1 hypothetical protein SARC_04580 [Sphaeroforma arctica JP610]
MMRRTSKRATTSKKSQAINARATPGRKYSGFDGTEGESPLNDPTKSQFEFLTDNKGEKVLAKFNAQLSPWTAHKRHGNTVYLASGLYDDDSDIDSGDSDYYTSDDETEDELEVNSVTKTTVAEPNENKRKSVRVSTNGSINRNSTHRSSTHDGLRIRLRRTPAQTTRKSLSRKSGQHRGSRNGESVRLSTKFNNPAMLLEETYEEGQGSIAEIGSSQTYIKSQANQHSFKYTPISHSNTYAYQPRVSKSVPTRRKNPDPRHKLEEMKQSQKGGSGRPPEIPLFPSAQTTQALPRGVDSLKADGASNMPSVRTPPPQRQAPRPPADPDQISIKYHASSIKSYNSDSLRSQRSTNSDGETSHRHGYNPGESNTSRVSGLTSVGRPSLTPSMGPGLGYHMPPKRKQSVPLIKDIWNNANAPNSGSSSLHSSMSASSGDIANKINGKTITADPYKDLGANTSIDTPQSYLTYDSSPSSTRSSTRTIGSSPSVPKRKRSLDSLRGMLIGPKNRTSGGTTERRLSIDAQGKRNVGRVYNIGSASDDETVKSGRAPEVYDMTVSLPELGVNVVAEACSLSDPLDINNIRSGTKLTVQVHKFRVCEGDTTVMKRRKLVFMMNHEAQTNSSESRNSKFLNLNLQRAFLP